MHNIPVTLDSSTWSIAELAAAYDVTLRTIRFYEDKGLLTPERFSLDEIATIVDMYDAEPGEEGQLVYLLDQIGSRRAELEQRRRDIDETLLELAEVERRCQADLKALRRS